jgi:hypothetical protein
MVKMQKVPVWRGLFAGASRNTESVPVRRINFKFIVFAGDLSGQIHFFLETRSQSGPVA